MTDQDRELVELAALAAGLQEHGWMADTYSHVVNNTWATFDPLNDDGDAFRLLCQRSMRIVEDRGGAYRAVQFTVNPEADDESIHEVEIEWPHTPAATRRAIVRAAASIGPQHHDRAQSAKADSGGRSDGPAPPQRVRAHPARLLPVWRVPTVHQAARRKSPDHENRVGGRADTKGVDVSEATIWRWEQDGAGGEHGAATYFVGRSHEFTLTIATFKKAPQPKPGGE